MPHREFTGRRWTIPLAICLSTLSGAATGADELGQVRTQLQTYCSDCHGPVSPEAGVDLEQAVERFSLAEDFKLWRRVAEMLEQAKMPPADAAQPKQEVRQQLVAKLRGALRQTAREHADDPGPVILRRLTSAEYAYTVQDLTGLALNVEKDFVSDAVGGEGFANVGSVQFMQDSTLERYLTAAKRIASHAVIGAGPLRFHEDPGKTGFELSAITRLHSIYRAHGFRTAAGEGGEAYGLDRYTRAFYVAWRFLHRDKLGHGNATLATLAQQEQIDARFAEYIWSILTKPNPSFPTSEIVARWKSLPVPANDPRKLEQRVRKECELVRRLLDDWQTRFGQNPDAKEEAPVLDESSFNVSATKQFDMNVNWPKGTKVAHIRINVESANRKGRPKATILWKNGDVQFRIPDQRLKAARPLRAVVAKADVARLRFGKHPQGGDLNASDFVTVGTNPMEFELPIQDGATSARLTIQASMDLANSDDTVVRCTISQEEETDQGKQVSALLANPVGEAFMEWKAGVLEFARTLPQVSHREPAPSDRDAIPPPFDNSYNNAERNHFHYAIKYHRDDKFLVDNIIDAKTRTALDQAWSDLLGSFEYHDAYLRFVAKKFNLELDDRRIATLDRAWIESLAKQPRQHVERLRASHLAVEKTFVAAQGGHVNDALTFAERAWRRPLTAEERGRLTRFYQQLREESELPHPAAIRALLTRILMAPEFLYRAERPLSRSKNLAEPVVPLTDWELASRLSYFLWSSAPDAELRRAASAGELSEPSELARHAKRMLRHENARRMATEFFGQWFGFYRFGHYRGIDVDRFPEFTDDLRDALHAEAVSFFEHIIRHNRPIDEILFADYTFLNQKLGEHYQIDVAESNDIRFVSNVNRHHRGGLLGLGAVLATTSAPRRTSLVKRGDWILRRVMGTPVPRPPADVGSIPADDVVADGLTVRTRLAAHRRNETCNNCHKRIDPLGFSLENYDPLGRWRTQYRDGKPIESSGQLADGSSIAGPEGLQKYLRKNKSLFHRTLCRKLVGYALGRRESISDVLLIEDMMDDVQTSGRFDDLIIRIVSSRQFRYRRAADRGSAERLQPAKGEQ